jgi:hypothetical protein
VKNSLLAKLLAYLFPGIDGENDDPVDTGNDDAGGSDDADDLDLPDFDDSEPPAASARAPRDDRDERLARLEAEVERRGRLAEEARRSAAAPVDTEFQREEERLRSPDTTDLERWQIQSNRTLRATQQQAQQAMVQAQDMMDRANFQSKAASDPRRTKYESRVEEAVAQERAAGRIASREAVYYYMLGKDIAEGKVKSKPKAVSSAPAVPRGKSPAVRSDVQGRGRPNSEKDKLRARLENMNI